MQFMLDEVHFLKINTLPSKNKYQFPGKVKNQAGNDESAPVKLSTFKKNVIRH
jgi:hypothetical protein